MPTVGGLRAELQRPLYDRNIVAVNTALASTIMFFTQPIGDGTGIANGPKRIEDTNLNESQKLPWGSDFLLRSIRFCLENQDCVQQDVTNLYKNYVLRLLINNTPYIEAPLWFFPAGGGAFNSGALSTAQLAGTLSTFGWNNGFPDPRAIQVFDIPIRMVAGETFRVELQGNPFTTAATASTTFGTGLYMRVVLDGELTGVVQAATAA